LLLQAALEFKANRLDEALATSATAKPDSAMTAELKYSGDGLTLFT
jgi:hypothetical protein